MRKAIYKGFLGDNSIYVQVLDKDHLSKIDHLQQIVYEALPDKKILQTLSEEELLTILNGKGLMIGAFVDEELIAFRALLVPEIDEEHLGYDIGLESEADLERVIYQEISNVHPKYRGFGLQKTLGKVIMQQVDRTKFDYVCATVMPYNIASLKDKFAQGMAIATMKYKYGGKLRYVFILHLRKEVIYDDDAIYIPMSDVEGQQQLLKNGFIGVAMEKADDDWVIEYKKVRYCL